MTIKRHKGVLFVFLIALLLTTTGRAQHTPVPSPLDQANTNQTNLADSVISPLPDQAVEQIAQQLVGAKLKAVPAIIKQLEATNDSRVVVLFQRLLDGQLYYTKTDRTLLVALKNKPEKTYQLRHLYSNKKLADAVAKKTLKKIKTSNAIRKKLRIAIAKLSLQSDVIETRLKSISDMMQNLSDESLSLLKAAKIIEPNARVKQKLSQAIALGNLRSNDELVRMDSLDELAGSLEPVVKNALVKLTSQNQDGSYVESSIPVRKAAQKALDKVNGKIKFYGYLERIFFGLSLGSILLLVAAGLAITFGVMGVINMAHGELIMLGAYTTYVIQLLMPNHIALSLLVAIPAAFLVSALFGVLIERGVIRFLKGRPLETLLATFGISLILQQLVRTVFSPLNRQVVSPEFMSGAWQINPVFSLTYNRLYILLFALIVFVLLQLLMKRTSLGLYVRAVSQNRNMARSMGIRSEWVDAMTFGLGSGVAGLAGVALSQITNVGPNLGQSYIIDSFMVVVFGGVGNLWGTLVGAFTIGALNKFLEPITGTVLATIIVLVGIILFIQKKPRGLFPQKGRAAES